MKQAEINDRNATVVKFTIAQKIVEFVSWSTKITSRQAWDWV